MAALVLSPKPRPSQNPAPQATIFFKAPQSSTVFGSSQIETLNFQKLKNFHKFSVLPESRALKEIFKVFSILAETANG